MGSASKYFISAIYAFFRVFLIVGLAYATLTYISNYMRGIASDTWEFVFSFVFFGGIMGLVNVAYLSYVYEKSGADKSDEDFYKVRQNKTIISSVTPDELLIRIKTSPFFSHADIVPHGHMIQIRFGASHQSLGEKMEINSKNVDNNEYRYQITSCPKVGFTTMDGGKNFENVVKLEHLLTT